MVFIFKMEYKCAPIYKYLIYTVIIFLFMGYYKNITSEKYLPIVLIFVSTLLILDDMLINDHPYLTDSTDHETDIADLPLKKEKKSKDSEDSDDIDTDDLEETELDI
jgi:hypothetical protein